MIWNRIEREKNRRKNLAIAKSNGIECIDRENARQTEFTPCSCAKKFLWHTELKVLNGFTTNFSKLKTFRFKEELRFTQSHGHTSTHGTGIIRACISIYWNLMVLHKIEIMFTLLRLYWPDVFKGFLGYMFTIPFVNISHAVVVLHIWPDTVQLGASFEIIFVE